MEKIFDFHFHLLFKHYITQGFKIEEDIEMKGVAKILDGIFGGPFDSQSSPRQLQSSPLALGVTSIIAVEHAFANRMLHIFGKDFSKILPLRWSLFERTKYSRTSYFAEFNDQIDFYLNSQKILQQAPYNVEYLYRKDWENKDEDSVFNYLKSSDKKLMVFSIEGGHNLSNVPIKGTEMSRYPELNLKHIQEESRLDFISLNLCHLSEIPEQPLGGFAQGANKMGQIAFSSEDFIPNSWSGLSMTGKKVVRQALTHPTRPILIDVKHMSLYTRLQYYKYREQLALEVPKVERLPVISSHTGFTFTSIAEYLDKKQFRSNTFFDQRSKKVLYQIDPENRKSGKTNDLLNSGLFCNPWTINLFDEEIIEIMDSGGLIGLSLDQRILGTSNVVLDSARDKYYETEMVAKEEWQKLFRDGKLPTAEEKLGDLFKRAKPSKPERHFMLLCLHIVHAVKVGYEGRSWLEGTSPWDHICIGSDFDGLINPINSIDSIKDFGKMKNLLMKYLPVADKTLVFNGSHKALVYNEDGTVNRKNLEEMIEKFLFNNGLKFIGRFLRNWE